MIDLERMKALHEFKVQRWLDKEFDKLIHVSEGYTEPNKEPARSIDWWRSSPMTKRYGNDGCPLDPNDPDYYLKTQRETDHEQEE